ncbi:MAG: hypothetical protein GX135_04775 [Candidatus Cloacimonetes bacterium]|nr:hypothetical protein [Candidatus Cloacimonadota bacterium]
MRRTIMFFALLLLASLLAAQESPAALSFKLLEANEYELDMFYSTELRRLYMQLDFEIPKSQLDPSFHYGFFLHKDAQIQSITVSGKNEKLYWVTNMVPEHFEPTLPQPELLAWNSPVRFFGIHLDKLRDYGEKAQFKIWYNIDIPTFELDGANKLSTGLDGTEFWHPHNLNQDTNIRLTLVTTPYMKLRLGKSFASSEDKQYSRTHKLSFIDSPTEPSGFRLIRD